MPSLFSRIRAKDGPGMFKSKKNGNLESLTQQLPNKRRWEDAYARPSVEPEEIQELVRRCTGELKGRSLDLPFLLLPFRPTSDPSAVRTFIRHFFDDNQNMQGEALAQELRMTEPMVVCGVLKWCWSRLPGGVVGWDAYELFKVGESDSNMARDSFSTFIPLSVENEARSQIIFDFFDLLSAVAAHGKMNGFGGRKLSRMAGWWAFEHKDTGNGFEGGYKSWLSAADAASHLFFAYLRSLSPSQALGGISMLPMSLQKLLQETEYPPQLPSLMQSSTNRVVMIVDSVSHTPFALLRRANHFQYRDEDVALKEFSEYEDPVKALTEECQRVLKAISLANESQVSSSKHSTSLRDASWSRFEDIGFAASLNEEDDDDGPTKQFKASQKQGLRTTPASAGEFGRPTTPSWADFLSSGFVDDTPNSPSNLLLPPDKILPPIETNLRQRSSQSHRPRLEGDGHLEPGELASITRFDLDDAFWWVWISSLAPEEPAERKAAFGRCAVIETIIRAGRWLVMEEMVKGAAPEPDAGAYIAEKKGFFSWTRRNKGTSRSKSVAGKRGPNQEDGRSAPGAGLSKTSIAPDQQAKIQRAAQQLQAKENQEKQMSASVPQRRGRTDADLLREKTSSILTLQPVIMSEASPALKWANKYDKESIRQAYLTNSQAGRGQEQANSQTAVRTDTNGAITNGNQKPEVPEKVLSPGLPPKPSTQEPRTPTARSPQEWTVGPERKLPVPADIHPAQRPGPTGRDSPLPPTPREHESMDAARENMLSPEPGASPESRRHKKLYKEEKKSSGGGLRKLFGRNKSRQSKLPENAAADLNAMLAQEKPQENPQEKAQPQTPTNPTQPSALEGVASKSAAKASAESEHAKDVTPAQTQALPTEPEPTFTPPPEEGLSRVDTTDALEANREFSRFDQGPLTDQPAFVPDDGMTDSEDEAAPPPIARHASKNISPESPVEDNHPEGKGAPSPSVPMQDRWAAIRRNAAERAARKSEEQSRGGYSRTTDGDDTSVEEFETRIKARVAELTGNMEANGPPGPNRR
ncbi:hypothetical protein DL763_006502 [Monosporascus cannonballus]|nr:hypothetical protein DL763_006502 [Monosporascus cannonballus]